MTADEIRLTLPNARDAFSSWCKSQLILGGLPEDFASHEALHAGFWNNNSLLVRWYSSLSKHEVVQLTAVDGIHRNTSNK